MINTVFIQTIADLADSKVLLADKGYDANGFHNALKERIIIPCIPGKKIENQKLFMTKNVAK